MRHRQRASTGGGAVPCIQVMSCKSSRLLRVGAAGTGTCYVEPARSTQRASRPFSRRRARGAPERTAAAWARACLRRRLSTRLGRGGFYNTRTSRTFRAPWWWSPERSARDPCRAERVGRTLAPAGRLLGSPLSDYSKASAAKVTKPVSLDHDEVLPSSALWEFGFGRLRVSLGKPNDEIRVQSAGDPP